MKVREATVEERLQFWPKSPESQGFVLEDEGRIVGQVAWVIGPAGFFVHDLAVREEYRSATVMLMLAVRGKGRELGLSNALFLVQPAQSQALLRLVESGRASVGGVILEMKL